MSIIKKAKERNRSMSSYARNRQSDDKAPTTSPKILDLSKLKDYVEKVVEFNKTKEKDVDGNRKYQYVFEWPIANVLGYIDEPTWVNMIECGLEWCIDNYTAVQPNGRWEVYDYEVKVDSRLVYNTRAVGKDDKGNVSTQRFSSQYDYLVLGVEFVDIKGERDLHYDMGRPTTKKESFDSELMKHMMKNAPDAVPVNQENKKLIESQAQKLEEQESQISTLREEQQKSNALMAELLAEMKKGATTKSTKSARSSK